MQSFQNESQDVPLIEPEVQPNEIEVFIVFSRTVYFTFQDRIFYFSGPYILLFRTVYFTF